MKKNKLIAKLNNNTFFSNISLLIGGTMVGQLLSIAISPILTRLYSPEDMGIYSIYISILSVLVVFASFRYETAIPLPIDDKESVDIVVLSIFLTSLISIVSLIGVLLYRDKIAHILNAEGLSIWLILLPISIFINGFFRVLNYWSVRRNLFQRLSSQKMVNSISTSISQVSLGIPNLNFNGGLIIGSIIGQFLSTVRLTVQTIKIDKSILLSTFRMHNIFRVFNRYKKFTFVSTFSDALNIFSTMLPSLFLAFYFDTTVVGLYSLGYRTLSLPAIIVGGAVAQVLLPRLVEANRQGNLGMSTFEMFKNLFMGGLVPIILITLVSPDLFGIIFGLDWSDAGVYVQLFSFWLFMVFITSPLSVVYIVKENQKPNLITNSLMVVLRIIGFIIAGYYGNVIVALALFGIIGVIFSSLNLYFILSMAGIKFNLVVNFILKQVILDSIFVIPTIIFVIFSTNKWVTVSIAIFSGVVFVIIKALHVFNKKIRLKGDLL